MSEPHHQNIPRPELVAQMIDCCHRSLSTADRDLIVRYMVLRALGRMHAAAARRISPPSGRLRTPPATRRRSLRRRHDR